MARGKGSKEQQARFEAQEGNYQDAAMDQQAAKGAGSRKFSNSKGKGKPGGKRGAGSQSRNGSGSRKGPNDASWYKASEQLTKDVTNIPTYIPLSTPIEVNTTITNEHGVGWYYEPQYTPGIMSFYIVQTLGDLGSKLSPINLASRVLYNYVRAANSRAATYSPEDLMMSIYAMTQPYLFLKWCQRAIGITNHFNLLDRYTPQALVASMKIDYQDLISNIGDFRTWLNIYALKVAQFPIPNGIAFFDKVDHLFNGVYKDANSPKAQYYIFNPRGFYVYSEGTVTGTSLTFTHLGAELYDGEVTNISSLNVAKLKELGDKLLNPLIMSEQTRDMCADLIKAFGSKLRQPAQIAENYSVVPEWSEEIMMQIENSTVMGFDIFSNTILKHTELNNSFIYQTAKGHVWTNSNGTYNLAFEANDSVQLEKYPQTLNDKNVLLNFHGNTPTSDDIINATRFTSYGYSRAVATTGNTKVSSGWIELDQTSTELILQAGVYYFSKADRLMCSLFASTVPMCYVTLNDSNQDPNGLNDVVQAIVRSGNIMSKISAFDWAPKVRVAAMALVKGTFASTWIPQGYYHSAYTLDLDNFTVISQQQLDSMHTAAKLGLFVPRDLGSYDSTRKSDRR